MATGFRGSHRDAEFFQCRPDAADMEEAIGKFMEGTEKQEHTGYSALHKLLQGLPVPVHNTAGSMTQAEALEGGFSALMVRYIPVHTSTY